MRQRSPGRPPSAASASAEAPSGFSAGRAALSDISTASSIPETGESSPLAFAPGALSIFFEDHPQPMWIFDLESLAFVAVNEAALRQYGYTREEFLGMTLSDIRSPEETQAMRRTVAKPFADACRTTGVWQHRRKDGSSILVEVTAVSVEFGDRAARLMLAQDVTLREHAIAALKESEARKSGILASARDCIVAADQEGHVTEFNEAAERAFGYSREEVIGRDIADIIVPYYLRSRHRRGWAHYIETGERHVVGKIVEMPALRADGTEFPAELSVTTFRIDHQRAFAASIRDLTERKRGEAQLAVQYAVSRALAESEDICQATREIVAAVCEAVGWDVGAIWSVDPRAQVIRMVDLWHIPGVKVTAFEEMSRELELRRGHGLPGRVWARGEPAWIPDVVDDANFPRASTAAKSGLHGAFGFPIKADDEVLGVIEFFSHEVREPDDELLQMFASVGSQIGQFVKRRTGEAKLRETNDMLQTLLLSSPLAIVKLDTDLVVRFWNPAAERLFGWSEAEVLHHPYSNILPEEKRDEFQRICEAVIRGREVMGFETVRRRKDGSSVRVLLSVAPLRGDGGEVTGMLGVVADLDMKKLV